MEINTFPIFQNGYRLLYDTKPNGRITGTLTESGQTHPEC